MINITVCGACGRMGSRVVELILNSKEFKLTGAVEVENHPNINKFCADVCITSNLEEVLKQSDVVIEFTTPQASLLHLKQASEKEKPYVLGTTGFKDQELEEIKNFSKKIPLVFSPNFSVGINLLFKLVDLTAKILPDYDVEIFEIHHNKKKDSPSGTALKLGQLIAQAKGKNFSDVAIFNRTDLRKPDEIGIFGLRAGDIIGEHTLFFVGGCERIELTHRAHSRDAFAWGALKAAKWIVNQKPGFYDMLNVLGF